MSVNRDEVETLRDSWLPGQAGFLLIPRGAPTQFTFVSTFNPR